jgi:ABC-type transporter Mla MlaB component
MITQDWVDDTHQTVRLKVKGAMTVAYAAELLPALTEAFAIAPTIHFDLSAVDEIDAAGLQLLCSSHRTAMKEGKQFHINGFERDPFHTIIIRAGYVRRSCCNPQENNPCILVGGMN